MMKLRLLAIAAALVAASGAHALTPAQIAASRTAGTLKEVTFSGASALRLTFGAYAAEICDTATLHVYFNGALPVDNTDGVNHRAYACKLKAAAGNYAAGTDVVIYKRDQSGSTAGANPIATNTAMAHMKIVDDATCAVTPNPTFSDILVPNYLCSGTENRVSDAGISDVEPAVLNVAPNLTDNIPGNPGSGSVAAVDLSNLVTNSFVQAIFGVAVNKQAYLALQKTQFPALAGATTIDESDAFRPSLPTSFIRGALTGGLSASNTTKRGWGLVISEAADAAVNTKAFNICRRQPGSGTQAASNLYFANSPCGGLAAAVPLRQSGTTSPAPAVTGSYIVNEQSGSGGVLNCLKAVDALTGAYGLAVIGRENNPLANGALPGSAGDGGYRYVKIDGMQPVRYDAATGKGAVTGDYDFVYESTLQYNSTNANVDADKLSFINAVRVNAPKPASLRVLDVDVQQGVASPSGAWAALGQYPALNANDKPFASRVARLTGQSCTTLKYVR
jgi:hypothetical protein